MKAASPSLSLLFALALTLIPTRAATLTWLGGAGDWADPAKWDGKAVPGPNDIVVINSGTVTVDWDSTILGLSMTGGTIVGFGPILITGQFVWTGGVMAGNAKTTLGLTATGTISGPEDKELARPFDNQGALTWSGGRILFRDATLTNNGAFNIAGGENFLLVGASGTFENSGTVNKTTDTELQFGGVQFRQMGTMNSVGVISSFYFDNDNLLAPGGAAVGAITIDGNFTQNNDGTLLLQLAGPDAYDRLTISGDTVLRGDLKIVLANGFVPTEGMSFTPLRFASHYDRFDNHVGLNISDTLYLEPTFTETNLTFTVKPRPTPQIASIGIERFTGAPLVTVSNVAGQDFVVEFRGSFAPGTRWTQLFTHEDSADLYPFVFHGPSPHQFFRVRRVD